MLSHAPLISHVGSEHACIQSTCICSNMAYACMMITYVNISTYMYACKGLAIPVLNKLHMRSLTRQDHAMTHMHWCTSFGVATSHWLAGFHKCMHKVQKKETEKSTLLGAMTGASVPRSSPRRWLQLIAQQCEKLNTDHGKSIHLQAESSSHA